MREKVEFPMKLSDWLIEGVLVMSLMGMLLEVFLHYSELPQQVPIHYNASGESGAYGGKSSILIMPVLAVLMYAGLTVLWKFPNIYNYPIEVTKENEKKLYAEGRNMIRSVKILIVMLFVYITHREIMVSLGEESGLGTFMVPIMLGAFFILLPFHLFRMWKLK